jgi:hypothetical protein
MLAMPNDKTIVWSKGTKVWLLLPKLRWPRKKVGDYNGHNRDQGLDGGIANGFYFPAAKVNLHPGFGAPLSAVTALLIVAVRIGVSGISHVPFRFFGWLARLADCQSSGMFRPPPRW